MSRRRRRVATAASSAATPILSEDERRVAGAIETSVSALQAVAQALLDPEVGEEGYGQAIEAFLASAETALGPAAKGVNFLPIIAAEGLAATVLMSHIVARAALDRPILVPRDDETQPPVALDVHDSAFGPELTDSLDELDRLDPFERAQLYLDDPTATAMAVGLYLARDGRSELFPRLPWEGSLLPFCLAVTAVATCALVAAALVDQPIDADDEMAAALEAAGKTADASLEVAERTLVQDPPLEPGVAAAIAAAEAAEPERHHQRHHDELDSLVETTVSALAGIEPEERGMLAVGGFGTVSQLVEDLLLASDFDLDVPSIRRLSATIVPVFMAAMEDDNETLQHELAWAAGPDDNEIARLLAGAGLAGVLAAKVAGYEDEDDEMPSYPPPIIH